MPHTEDEAKKVGTEIGIDWEKVDFDPSALAVGMDVETEHGSKLGDEVNVTNDDPKLTAMIAWAHLKESPKYYEALALMESQLEKPTEAMSKSAVTSRVHRAYMKTVKPGQKGIDRTISPALKKLIQDYLAKITAANEDGTDVDTAFKKIRPDLSRYKPDDLINMLWENQHVGMRPLSVLKSAVSIVDFFWALQLLFEIYIREQAMQWWSALPTKQNKQPEKRDNEDTIETPDKGGTVPDEEGTKVETPKGKRGASVVFRGHRYREL